MSAFIDLTIASSGKAITINVDEIAMVMEARPYTHIILKSTTYAIPIEVEQSYADVRRLMSGDET